MSDFKELREALEAGPTDGPWVVGNQDRLNFGKQQVVGAEPLGFVYDPTFPERSEYGKRALATSRFIAAANPATIRSLLAELDEVRRDAERYRWLRDIENGGEFSVGQHCSVCDEYPKYEEVAWYYDTELDDLIDAMKEQQP